MKQCQNNKPVVLSGRKCGDWYMGELLLCPACKSQAKLDYPQGWQGYPGDVCQHGRYTGGIGPDLICGDCESGA